MSRDHIPYRYRWMFADHLPEVGSGAIPKYRVRSYLGGTIQKTFDTGKWGYVCPLCLVRGSRHTQADTKGALKNHKGSDLCKKYTAKKGEAFDS